MLGVHMEADTPALRLIHAEVSPNRILHRVADRDPSLTEPAPTPLSPGNLPVRRPPGSTRSACFPWMHTAGS